MIEIIGSKLRVSFPEVHPEAVCEIQFERTLRVPDDGKEYPLPAGLSAFPLFPVEDYPTPEEWKRRGGVFLPMYQSEAMWIYFRVSGDYPFAVKVAAGKINAVDGEPWKNELSTSSQDYLALPAQPWLDGFCVSKGIVRQFVAAALGEGHTAEEQLTGKAEWGGLQLIFYPMKADEYRLRFELPRQLSEEIEDLSESLRAECEALGESFGRIEALIRSQAKRVEELSALASKQGEMGNWRRVRRALDTYAQTRGAIEQLQGNWGRSFNVLPSGILFSRRRVAEGSLSMGLAGGGKINQEIVKDPFGAEVWDTSHASRCYVHLINAEQFRSVTGKQPPSKPLTPEDYKAAGIPWFDYYLDTPAVEGSSKLAGIVSLATSMLKKGQVLGGNKSMQTGAPIVLKANKQVVKEGDF